MDDFDRRLEDPKKIDLNGLRIGTYMTCGLVQIG